MGIYYIPQVYKSVVEKHVDVYIGRFLGELENPEFKVQAQQRLCGLIEKESKGLMPDIVSGNEVNESLDIINRAKGVTALLEKPDIDSLRKIFMRIAEKTITNQEIIGEAKRRGIGRVDNNAIYVA